MAAQAPGHAGEAHAAHPQMALNRLGLWFFFLSETFLFGLLAAARFYLNGTETPEHLNQELGLVVTGILLLSSLTAYRAETAITHGNRGHAQVMLLATIALGLVFAGGVAYEWSIAEFDPSDGFGTSFFSMTGMHAAHVITGVFFLILAYRLVARGSFGPGDSWGITAIVMYWHFVDIVWVFFYPTLYLLH